MPLRMFACLALLLAQTALPPIDELARDARRNQSRSYQQLTEYTYDYRHTLRLYNGQGKLRQQTVTTGESYQSARRNVDVEFTRNGKPHSRRTVEKKRKAAAWQMQTDYEARLKQSTPPDEREFGADIGSMRMETFATLRHCPLSRLRQETINGRPTYVLDFGPAPPGTKFSRENLKHLTQSRGTLWIDAEDRIVSQWKASTLQGEFYFEQTNQRLEPGVWGIAHLRMSPAAAPALFAGERQEWIFELTNPKKFSVSVDQKIAEPPKP